MTRDYRHNDNVHYTKDDYKNGRVFHFYLEIEDDCLVGKEQNFFHSDDFESVGNCERCSEFADQLSETLEEFQ